MVARAAIYVGPAQSSLSKIKLVTAATPITTDPCDASSGAPVVYALHAKDGVLDVARDRLLAVAQYDEILPLPWSLPGTLGLVSTELGPLLVISPVRNKDDTESGFSHRLIAVLETPKGKVALVVERVSVRAAGDRQSTDADHEKITMAVAALGNAQLPNRLASSRSRSSEKAACFIHVRSGGVEWAIPVAYVEHIGKDASTFPVSADEPQFRLVEINGAMVVAESLAARMGYAPAKSEPWVLACRAGGSSSALLVESVLGIIETEPRHLAVFRHGPRPGAWLALPGRAPMTVPDFTLGAEVRETAGVRETIDARKAPGTVVRLHVGQLQLVFSGAQVTSVPGRLEAHRLAAQRCRGGLPVIDLGRLFGESDAAADFAVTVRIGRNPVILLCDRAEVDDDLDNWPPMPALPQPLPGLFDAISLDADGVAYRVAAQPARVALRQALALSAMPPFRGWLPPDSFLAEAFDCHV